MLCGDNRLLTLWAYQILHEETQAQHVAFNAVGRVKMLDINHLDESMFSSPELRNLLSSYREALNSSNVFHQALCFFKSIECMRKLRTERYRKLKKLGKSLIKTNLRIPENLEEWPLDQFYKATHSDFLLNFLGKRFEDVVENFFRPVIRNAIAHLDPANKILDADRFYDLSECEKAVPILKYIARRMIDHEKGLQVDDYEQ